MFYDVLTIYMQGDYMKLIGRKTEQEILFDSITSSRPEFLVVYGRRRVGKTYLIREYFNNRFSFYATGLPDAKTRNQLSAFNEKLIEYGSDVKRIPKNWMEAFQRLRILLERDHVYREPLGNKRVIFLDEVPWMSTARSDFKSALDLFWNGWACTKNDILLIVCGSAASWIIDHILLDTGGFYNRMTRLIHMMPFTLKECAQLLTIGEQGLSHNDIIDYYLVFGGIPHYINMYNSRLSVAQNIDSLLYSDSGPLRFEYDMVFKSLFKNSDHHLAIVNALANRKSGLTRDDLLKDKSIVSGETLTKVLLELEQSGFIRKYTNFTTPKTGCLYQLIDPFTLYSLNFIKSGKLLSWSGYIDSPGYYSWRGNAFEILCLNHIEQIKSALGIPGVISREYSWRSKKSTPGVQIDLLIDRNDNVINLCEMKYSDSEFSIDTAYRKELLLKREVFRKETGTRKTIRLTMITVNGLAHNTNWQIIQNEITVDELF